MTDTPEIPGMERGTLVLVIDGEKSIRPWPEVIRLLEELPQQPAEKQQRASHS